jgi:UDP-N-acetylglucosamine diphosphorylase / glucose-1-phosphate thymidylyltransferase / UDP-N-acetylgalactosamine diphosphorylase / glucosamine-1-phosphate N-acetyltransferase / galactosamine-1-phosphate N-acetyltransferase
MNVVIPMAGRGSRLSVIGAPKPLVEVAGKPLLAWSTRWLNALPGACVTVIALQEHERDFGLVATVAAHMPGAGCMLIPEVTQGQLCTVLCAAERLDPEAPLLIAPCDTMIEGPLPIPSSLNGSGNDNVRGIVSVASMPGDRWSFAECDAEWNVSRVAEKVRISEWASTGLYYFAHTGRFLEDARRMVEGDERVKGEFYVMPLYSRMLSRGERIKAVPVEVMHDLGTPDALGVFEKRISAGL